MENHWNVECANCGLTLRLTVKEKDFGKTVKAICPRCKTQTRTTVGMPKIEEDVIPPNLELLVAELTEKIATNPEVAKIVDAIKDVGFSTFLAMGFCEIYPGRKTKPTPKVDRDGKIKVGTFTDEDKENFKKFFKIDL